MQQGDPYLTHSKTLLAAGHAGVFTIPDEVLEVERVEQTVSAKLAEVNAKRHDDTGGSLVSQLAERVLQSARVGKMPDDLTGAVLQGEEQERRTAIEQRVMALAADTARQRLVDTVMAEQEAISAALAEAFDDTIAEARKVAPALKGRALDDRSQVLDWPPAQQDKYKALELAGRRYQALLEARRHLRSVCGEPRVDTSADFTVLRNPQAAWGGRWAGRNMAKDKPWPTDPTSLVAWLATTDAQPWFPSAADQDAAAAAVQVRTQRTLAVSI